MDLGDTDWIEAKSLFHSMLDMEPSQWHEFLAKQGTSPELSTALVELLRAHKEAGSFLDPHALQESLLHQTTQLTRLHPGDVLAERFKIVQFLARGGMGEVYLADDLELRMPVAVKVIRPQIADYPGVLARFRREVQLAKQVTHPNVCRIFDIFRHKDHASGDVIFLTMELLSGETLSQRLRRIGRIPELEAITILHQLISALEAAHSVGILHRDLKPGNIVLEIGKNGEVRAVITDFGMALSGQTHASSTLTTGGQFAFGTLEYMSPEQIESKELSPASDIYSLGLVAYQMVTGLRAFEAETPLYSALRRLTESPPVPTRSQQALNPAWDSLIARALERNPDLRIANASDFRTCLTGLEAFTSRRKHWNARGYHFRLRDASRLSRWIVIAAAAIAAVTAAFAIRHFHTRSAPVEDLTVVLADFVNTTGEPAFDHALNVALSAKLQQTPYLTLMPDQKIRTALRYMGLPGPQRLTADVARQVCEREGGQVVLQGFIANNAKGYTVGLSATRCQSGKEIATEQVPVEFRDSVLEALDRAAEAIRPVLGESTASIRKYDVPLSEATTPSFEAVTAFAQGTDAWNQRGEAAALPFFQKATEIDPNFAMAYARLGTVYGNMGETQRANEAMRQAYDRRDRVTEWERFYIVSHYYGFVTGEVDKEMQTYEEWAKAYPHDMAWTINLSVDYAFTGQYQKAIDLQRRAIRETPGLSPSYGNLAQLFLAIDDPDEASAVLEQATNLNLHDVNIQLDQYELAFYRKDKQTMSSLLEGASRFPGVEDTLLAQQAATEDSGGRTKAGIKYSNLAARIATQNGAPETSANWLAGEALRQAELGQIQNARRLEAEALADPKAARGSDVEELVALASSESGAILQARSILHQLSSARPFDTLIQSYWVPVVRARIAYAEGEYKLAVQLLNGTDPYDLGVFTPGQCMDAAYARGQAFLADRQPMAAEVEFKKIIEHRGLVLNCPTSTLAQLGLARSLAQAGEVPASEMAYQDLFALCKDSDPDFALLKQARIEYRALH